MKPATCLFVCSLSITLVTSPVRAQDSAGHSIAASTHASKAVGAGMAGSGRVALGVSAAPLIISGAGLAAAGLGIAVAGSTAVHLTNSPSRRPLPVSDETITVMSPAAALKPVSSNDAKEPHP